MWLADHRAIIRTIPCSGPRRQDNSSANGTTERSQKQLFRTILRGVPISKKLQFMVFVFVCIFFAVLGLVFLCSSFTSAARAYVQGEGSRSKAQKQAERNTMLLQKPFTAKKILEVIQQMNVSVRS